MDRQPKPEAWKCVLERIERIGADLSRIEDRLGNETDAEVICRLEALQEKFERVMGQLSSFDDGDDVAICEAKAEFQRIANRWLRSRERRIAGTAADLH